MNTATIIPTETPVIVHRASGEVQVTLIDTTDGQLVVAHLTAAQAAALKAAL